MMDSTTRTRTFSWDDPMITAVAVGKTSGLEFLRAMIRGEMPRPPFASMMDMELVEVDEGRAVFTGKPAEFHYNPIGVVHGGFASTLLDSALGCAVQSTLPVGMAYTTVELHVNLLRPITAQTGIVRAEGKIVHAGRRMAMADARLTDSVGKLYAHGTTTCMIFPVAE